jgi:hypothetical protein
MPITWKNILVSSGYGGNTREPFVEIKMDYPKDHPLQIHPDEARQLAMNLLEAAEAADTDSFLFEFVSKDLNTGDKAAAGILMEYRKFRDERRGK